MSTKSQLQDALSTEHLHTDLKGRSVRGGVLTLTSQGSQFMIQSISTVVLARLLTPADFGLVAMVTAIIQLAISFADFGLSEATIQRDEISHDQVSTLFWINVAIGFALMLVTIALAPLLVWFYKEPRLKDIAFALSLLFLINGLRVQHEALLKRRMRFSSLAIRDVFCLAVAVPVAIIMARRGAGYWALVVLPLTATFGQMAISWLMVGWMPGLPRRAAKVGSLVVFGGNVAASYVIMSVNRSVDMVLIGWYWGAGPLGLYSRAYNLLMLPVRQVNAPATSIAVPTFSRLQNDPERYTRYFLRAANLTMWIATPIFGFLFVAAEPVIILVLGNKWREAAPVFQILAICALAQLLFQSTVWLFVSQGQAGRLLKLLLIISPIFVVSYAIGLPFGVKGVALSGSIVFVGTLPWVLKYAFRGTQLTLQRLGQAIVRPIALCLAGVLSAELGLYLIAPHNIISQLLVVALGFSAAYLLSVFVQSVRDEAKALTSLISELRLPRDVL
jgi:PST family polysaccharide transporter